MRALFSIIVLVLVTQVLAQSDKHFEDDNRFYHPIAKNYSAAVDYCKARRANLVRIQTPDDSLWHYGRVQYVGAKRVWLALNRRTDTEDKKPYNFVFEGYGNQRPVTEFWGPGEPNNFRGHQERCVEVRVLPKNTLTHNWNDRPCSSLNTFFCEKVPHT